MRIQIDIEENVDDAGIASYRAWYGEEDELAGNWGFDGNWCETRWEAIQSLCDKIITYEDENEVVVE